MHMRYVRVTIILLMMAVSMMGQTLRPAGTTPDQATRVTETITLSVQPGANYIGIKAANLPAVVTYMPDTAFGPLPIAIMDEDTLDVKVAFENCAMTWTWEVGADDVTKIVEILAHEDASLLVVPTVCPMSTDTVVDDAWDSFEWRGTVYTESGEYTIPHETQYCSWTETLHLTIHTTSRDTYAETGCDSVVYNDKKYTETGAYTDTLMDVAGNRTIMTLNLTINHPSKGEETLTACDSLLWNGKWYKESGDYTYQTKNAGDCDSTVTLHLTINNSVRLNKRGIEVDDRYVWGDTVITTSGVYTRRFQTVNGCDSIVTQQITVHKTLVDTTVYFCPGMHNEEVIEEGGVKTRYVAYQTETPSPDWYMEGVILEAQKDQTLVDFRRAEQNFREHYQLPLVPLTDIVWTYRSADGQESYVMEPKEDPQWVKAGTVSVVVRFLCGAPYYSDFTTDVEEVDVLNRPSKVMENGMVVIIRGGKRYNLLGTKIQ